MSIGAFSGASCGILLATPVALTDPICRMSRHSLGNVFVMVGLWAICGVICGSVSAFVIKMIDVRIMRLPLTKRRVLRSIRYWWISFGILVLAACASLIPFWRTFEGYRTDGMELARISHHTAA
jgi:hypothetical protein